MSPSSKKARTDDTATVQCLVSSMSSDSELPYLRTALDDTTSRAQGRHEEDGTTTAGDLVSSRLFLLPTMSMTRFFQCSDRKIVQNAMMLGRKWACAWPGHELCWMNEEGVHVPLTDDQIMTWVEAMVSNRFCGPSCG